MRGEKRFVPFANSADIFLVSANTGPGDDDSTLFVVRREDIGDSEIVPMKTASGSPLGQVKLRGVRLPEDAVLGGRAMAGRPWITCCILARPAVVCRWRARRDGWSI